MGIGENAGSNVGENTGSSGGALVSDLYTPTGFSVDAVTSSTATVSWVAPLQGTAYGYRVYDSGFTLRGTSAWPSTGMEVIGLSPDTSYVLHVVTYDRTNISTASNTGTATTTASTEAIFYADDFETGTFVTNTPNPAFQVSNLNPTRVGAGNIVDIDTTYSNTGAYSLRFNFLGRNGAANQALLSRGLSELTSHVATGHDAVNYFVDSSGTDLTIKFAVGDFIWNNDNIYSKWQITSFVNQNLINDRANLTLVANPIDSSVAEFNSSDSVIISPANLISSTPPVITDDRRSDFNNAIFHFFNTGSVEPYLPAGQSYFRRYYLRFNITNHPWVHMKITYLHDSDSIMYLGSTDGTPDTLFFSLSYRSLEGKDKLSALNYPVVNDTWYYIELEYLSETSPDAGDGLVRAWISESGSEPAQDSPTIVTPFGKLRTHDNNSKMTLLGNVQHWNDVSGYINIDNVKVSNRFIGAA